jgi:hypothetical protein
MSKDRERSHLAVSHSSGGLLLAEALYGLSRGHVYGCGLKSDFRDEVEDCARSLWLSDNFARCPTPALRCFFEDCY